MCFILTLAVIIVINHVYNEQTSCFMSDLLVSFMYEQETNEASFFGQKIKVFFCVQKRKETTDSTGSRRNSELGHVQYKY